MSGRRAGEEIRLVGAVKGGQIVGATVPELSDKMKMDVAISVAGVSYTEDGSRSWQP